MSTLPHSIVTIVLALFFVSYSTLANAAMKAPPAAEAPRDDASPIPTPKPGRRDASSVEAWIGLSLITEAGDWIGIVERIEWRSIGGSSEAEIMVRQADWTFLGVQMSWIVLSGDRLVLLDREPQ